ncbi:alpha-xenorhabdolysin family binary toxin subunit B [Providencia sp. Je.9.19]|uniref:alpha-xenorhabdolysin family binary toxin subunit B n=1 Tax=Providencia sp. Je.9.19 TaxID=3142844 RepID=UPI003DA941F0
MKNNFVLPISPSIDIYSLRCTSNNINAFNKNIISYDLIIHNRIKKISVKIEQLNEFIRSSIPILKIKSNYILINDLDSIIENNTDILTTNFIDDLIDLKSELERIISKLNILSDGLLVYQLDEPNKTKRKQYTNKKEMLIKARENTLWKISEINNHLLIVIAAEEIILNGNLLDFFEKYFIGDDIIDLISIPPNKKDILKAAIVYVKKLLTMVDDGLEFKKLVDVRLYLNQQLIDLRKEENNIDNLVVNMTQLIDISNEITVIDTQKYIIITQIELLKNYWGSWCHFINQNIAEQTPDLAQINIEAKILITYLDDIEYQYQRQLPD